MKIAIFTGTIDLAKIDARGVYIIGILKHLTKFKDLEIILITPNSIQDELKNNFVFRMDFAVTWGFRFS